MNVREYMKTHNTCYVAKKGKRYMAIRSNELVLVRKQLEAEAFPDQYAVQRFIQNAVIDDRNANVMGNHCDIVPLYKEPPT